METELRQELEAQEERKTEGNTGQEFGGRCKGGNRLATSGDDRVYRHLRKMNTAKERGQ